MTRWLLACLIGEAAGMAGVALAYAALDRGLLEMSVWILAGGAWEGLCLGTSQAWVLGPRGVRRSGWILMTVLAAVLGYSGSLAGSAAGGGEGSEPSVILIVGFGVTLGIVMGVLMGAFQWISARTLIRAKSWLLANAIGWALAMPVIMLAASTAGADWRLEEVGLLGAASGGLAGLLLGVSTFRALPEQSETTV
tara:strand:- start:206 stop:790 length:585 start_codon:yes stop_codon:yes gene_type:complete